MVFIYLYGMKGAVAFLLIAVLLMQIFSMTIIFVSFKINQDYIARNLCENRAIPGEKCCGKCLLKKQLKKDEQKQDSRLPSSQKNFDELVFMSGESFSEHFLSFFNREILFERFAPQPHASFSDGIFHPPTFSC